RMSLGGVRDEAEIRGHRRTYFGSMPGRIVQNLNKVGTKNPLFMLDEIDKMSMDFRGDPSSALLDVLDPEQNNAFNDHYLEVDLDLSEVMFVATSNSLNIPGPLLDRMEVIRIPGYTEDEKINIATRYLVPKQMKANGLRDGELKIAEDAIQGIVRYYTRESGVRNLEREIAKICRKVVKEIALRGPEPVGAKKKKPRATSVTAKNLEKYLGVQRYDFGRAEQDNEIGLVTGLAWTEVGGDPLRSEEHTSELQSRENLVCRLLLEDQAFPRPRPSFPTRRSSDLRAARPGTGGREEEKAACHQRDRQEPREVPWRAALRLRPRRAGQRDRPRHRPGLDRGRRRPA